MSNRGNIGRFFNDSNILWASLQSDTLETRFKIKYEDDYTIKIPKNIANKNELFENNNIKLNLYNNKKEEKPITKKPIKLVNTSAQKTQENAQTILIVSSSHKSATEHSRIITHQKIKKLESKGTILVPIGSITLEWISL